jgi:hypothetical protein
MDHVKHVRHSLQSDARAITVLLAADQETQALAIMYGAMDRAAWLLCTGDDVTGSDFKAWVNQFLIAGQTTNFNSEDLWAARCALLHTGAAESANYRKNKARLIYYKVKQDQPDDQLLQDIAPWLAMIGVDKNRVVLVDHLWLAHELLSAFQRFEDFLQANPIIAERASAKADMQLTFQVYTPPD